MNLSPSPEIYEDIEELGLPDDRQGFPSSISPVFEDVVAKCSPRVVIEVGSWKGVSACRWAQLGGPECVVYCVDTWLGGFDQLKGPVSYAIPRTRGLPTVYLQFLANVYRNGYANQIIPIPNTSATGARLLKQAGATADLVYIDGSHEYRDVCNDLEDYWPLVRPGGCMLVDDVVDIHGVFAAVVGFVETHGLRGRVEWPEDGKFSLLTKPL